MLDDKFVTTHGRMLSRKESSVAVLRFFFHKPEVSQIGASARVEGLKAPCRQLHRNFKIPITMSKGLANPIVKDRLINASDIVCDGVGCL
jgi:hypothetical protein